jgi:hypothetical protein
MPVKIHATTLLLIVCTVAAAGCASPETRRTRGGGPGADVGNRSQDVKMHGGSNPFWRTPDRIEDVHHPPLAGARQAERLSR